MRYYITSLNTYVDDRKDNVLPAMVPNPDYDPEADDPGPERIAGTVTYTRGTIAERFPDAVPMPTTGEFERVVEGDTGWEIEPWTQEEIDSLTSSRIEGVVASIWQERYEIANHPMTGLDPAGAIIVNDAANAGNVKAQEIGAWLQALYDEAHAREAAVRNGEELGEWTTPKQKPHSVSEVIE